MKALITNSKVLKALSSAIREDEHGFIKLGSPQEMKKFIDTCIGLNISWKSALKQKYPKVYDLEKEFYKY